MNLKGKTIQEIKVGDTAFAAKTITEADLLMFGAVSTDFNPAHFNEEYAKNTMFKKRIAHGILSVSLVSSVLGMQLPGPGGIYISQTVKFKAPVFIGDTITAYTEVKEIITEKNRVVFRTYVTNQDEKLILDGEAVIMPPK